MLQPSYLSKAPVAVVRLNHDVPPDLERIIRNLRYQHAADMQTEFAAAEAGYRDRTSHSCEFRHGGCRTGKRL